VLASLKQFEYTLQFQTREGVEYLLLTPDRCLIFPSVDYVRNLVTKHSMKQAIPVVIDCSHIYGADFTAAKVTNC
jgi:sodium-independent sulfate anion transporter 11